MYPLYQNQKPYYWENHAGKKLLVWSGEHYNLGNALGLVQNKHANFMTENYLGKEKPKTPVESFKDNLYDYLKECADNEYTYNFMITSVSGAFIEKVPAPVKNSTRVAYTGSERVRDIINSYDPVTYTLPYGVENEFFKISYEIGKGITSFYDKLDKVEMLKEGDARFFTPIYENTEIRTDIYEERRLLGRNIRGVHAKKYIGELTKVRLIDNGAVFKTVELIYKLEGTYFSSIVIKMYSHLPKIEFKYKIAKTFLQDIENILLPLTLNLPEHTLYVDKSDVYFRPGIDQIPGTCMEYLQQRTLKMSLYLKK